MTKWTTKSSGCAVAKPRKSKDSAKREALELLEITEADVLSVPRIEPLLAQAGVLDRVWDYVLAASEVPIGKKLLQRYDLLRVAGVHKAVPFEAYCVACDVWTSDAVAMITKVMKTHVDLLTKSKQLGTLTEGKNDGITQRQDVALLPPIEDEIRQLSDRFNESLMTIPASEEDGEEVVEEE